MKWRDIVSKDLEVLNLRAEDVQDKMLRKIQSS
jgi:hypothetical protein